MSKNIINRLFSSFVDLEQAINSAKVTLAAKGGIPESVMTRINSYDGILAKQRHLAQSLCQHIDSGDWDEVSRHVALINGLSSMIRDDAKAILSSISLNSDVDPASDEKISMC